MRLRLLAVAVALFPLAAFADPEAHPPAPSAAPPIGQAHAAAAPAAAPSLTVQQATMALRLMSGSAVALGDCAAALDSATAISAFLRAVPPAAK